VVEPLMKLLYRALGYENVHLTTGAQVSDGPLVSAFIHLILPNREETEGHVREAWWAGRFRASPSATALPCAAGAAIFHVRSTFVRNIGREIGRRPAPLEGMWDIVEARKVRASCDAVIWLVITLGFLANYVLGVSPIIPLYVFLLLPFALLVYSLAVIGHLVAHWWSSWQLEPTVLLVPVMQRFAEGLTGRWRSPPSQGLDCHDTTISILHHRQPARLGKDWTTSSDSALPS
jgi:hypothetical protein